MKKAIILIFSIFVVSFVFGLSCPMNPPVYYQGNISYNDSLLEGNYNLNAILNGDINGSIIGQTELSAGEYYIEVSPCQGVTSGTISFVVNGIEANEQTNYNGEDFGGEFNQSLTLNELPPEENVCGNGEINVGEECDDGNTNSSDGCSEMCEVEFGYSCTGQPSVCNETGFCGDNQCRGDETCETCPQDCGKCKDDGDDNNNGRGSSGGGGGGEGEGEGEGESEDEVENLTIKSTTENITENTTKNTKVDENKEESFFPRITGAVTGFTKSKQGIGIISLIAILVGGLFVIKTLNNKKINKNNKNEE